MDGAERIWEAGLRNNQCWMVEEKGRDKVYKTSEKRTGTKIAKDEVRGLCWWGWGTDDLKHFTQTEGGEVSWGGEGRH